MVLGLICCYLPILIFFILCTFVFKLKISRQLIAILIGLAAVLPISTIQFFLPQLPILPDNPVLHSLIRSILIYGFIEEVLKMLLLLLCPHKDVPVLEFLLLSFAMGLTLGCFESSIYFFDHLQKANAVGARLLYLSIFVRILSSDIIHLCCAGFSGIMIYGARNSRRKISLFVLSFLIHGIYDFFAGFHGSIQYFSIAVILFAIIECRSKYKDFTAPEEPVPPAVK